MSGTGDYYAPYAHGANLYSSPINNMPQQNSMMNAGIVTALVANEVDAQSYPVGAGNTVLLIDFNQNRFWLKSTAANGVPMPMRSFAFEEKTVEPAKATVEPANDYVTKADFDELKKMIGDLLK